MARLVFDEVEFPILIGYTFVGGPQFNNTIIPQASGYEHANKNWSSSKRTYSCQQDISLDDYQTLLLPFFEARHGNMRGFRFKDVNDYKATAEALVVTGSPTIQLTKLYDDTANPIYRDIKKVRSSPAVTMTRNASNFTAFTLNYNTGILTLTEDSSKTITAITKANPGQITATAHGFSNGDIVYISGVVGMTEINAQLVTVTVVDANNFTIGVNTSAYSTYTSGGTAKKYVQPTEDLEWTGEFDVPVRFTDPGLSPVRESATSISVSGLEMMEIKV